MPQWKSSISIDSFATESTRIEIFLLLYLFISYIQEYPFWLLEFLLKWSSTFMTKSGSRIVKSSAATLRLRTSTFQYQNSPFVCLCIEIVLNVFIGRDKQPFTQWTTPTTTFAELTAFRCATTLSRESTVLPKIHGCWQRLILMDLRSFMNRRPTRELLWLPGMC